MKYIIPIAIQILIAVLVLGGCSGGDGASQKEKTIAVTVAPVEYGAFTVPVNASGRLSVGTEMKLSFKTGGVVDRFRVSEGDRVSEGQVLASLKLAEINAQVEMARSSLAKAERDLERAENLYADSVATLEQVQNAETSVRVARAQAEIAEFNLEHSIIRAPSDGIVLKRLVEPNELVSSGMPILYMGTTDEMWTVDAGIPDREVVRLSIGDSAWIVFDTYPSKPLKGRVSEISESPNPLTGTYEIKLSLEPTDIKLLSGFSARITIYPDPEEPHYLVPIDALTQPDGLEGTIFTVDSEQRAKGIAVRIDYILDDRVAIPSGLEDVDRVITAGAEYVTDGTPVAVRNTQPPNGER